MTIFNVWLEIRDDFNFPAADPEDDSELQAKNRQTLSLAGDQQVVTGLFKGRSQGPRTWAIYSLAYQFDTIPELEQAVELFQSENPGKTNVMGAWYFEDGEQVKDNNVPLYPIPGNLLGQMPDIVTYDQDGNETSRTDATELTDVNLLLGQAPRNFS